MIIIVSFLRFNELKYNKIITFEIYLERIFKMCMENNLKKASMSQFEWYDRGEHDYQWLIKHHKKLANRYERDTKLENGLVKEEK